MKDLIFNYIERQKQEILYLQKGLVSIPALSPENGGDGELEKCKFLMDFLKKKGFSDPKLLIAEDLRVSSKKRPNLVYVLKGKDSTKTIWIVSHLDVVPPGDLSLWNSEPFDLKVDGDLLYGRGVEDNHHGLVASILAAETFISCKITPSFNFGLMFVSDEETGSRFGLDFVLKDYKELFSQKDEFLVPDFGNGDSTLIEVAEKSMVWLKVIVEGKQCHASTPSKGINSLVGASAMILKINSLYKDFNHKNTLFDPPISTFEPTKKESNVPNVNTIPGRDVFYVDMRLLPELRVDDVMKKIEEYKEEVKKEFKIDIKIEMIHKEPSSFTSVNCFLVDRLKEAIKEIYNKEAEPRGIGGGTVAAFPRRYGYPAVAWATLLGTAHQPNEHTSLSNIINDAKVMSLLFM